MNVHLALLIVYSIGLTAAGLWISRLVRGSGDFFVAGRALSPRLIFATFLAANIGAGTTVGATGLAYYQGISAWWWVGSAGIGSLVLARWIGPRLWRLASEHGFYTAGDYLEHRYGQAVRGVVAVLIWVGTLAVLAAQLLAGAAVLNVVAGLTKTTGIIIGGVVMTIYFVAGGLLGSARVNAIQLVVLLGGFLLAIPLLHLEAGGFAGMAAARNLPDGYWSFFHSSGAGSGWALAAMLVPAFIISPGLIQKTYGAANERAVRTGIGWQGIALMVFAWIPVYFGIAGRAEAPGIEHPDFVLPAVLANELPVAVGALALAAVFSAEVSTCDAILFMLATSLSQDLYKRFINPCVSDRGLLLVARLSAVAGGAAGVLLAIQLETIVGALSIFYSLLGASLFVPVLGGLFTRRAGAPEAFAAMAAGIGTLLTVHFRTGGAGYGIFNPNLLGLVAAAVAFGIVLAVRGANRARSAAL